MKPATFMLAKDSVFNHESPIRRKTFVTRKMTRENLKSVERDELTKKYGYKPFHCRE